MDNKSRRDKQHSSYRKNDRRLTGKKHFSCIRELRTMHIQRSIKKALQK